MNKLQTLQYHPTVEIRMIMQDNEPWWLLLDVCKVLNIQNSREVVKRLDDDEKSVDSIDTPSGPHKMTIINESGLYSVILWADKPEAKTFKRWITHEVLPSIRRTETCSISTNPTTYNTPLHSLETSPLSTTSQLLLRVLQDLSYAMPTACGEVQISNRRLARLMGLGSNNMLIAARKELVKAGYIEFSPGIRNYPSIYQIRKNSGLA